jgi:pimeloyl-ACP methyl ester carboxylesterase
VTIFAHSHLGLSSYIQVGADSDSDSKSSSSSSYPETSNVALTAQIQAHLEFLDELLAAYGSTTRVLLVGHSIGSWLIQEILKARAGALRPRVGAYMLFPTISHIIRTPNGRKLSVRVSAPPLLILLANPVPLVVLPGRGRPTAFFSPALATDAGIPLTHRQIRHSLSPMDLRTLPALLAEKSAAGLA